MWRIKWKGRASCLLRLSSRNFSLKLGRETFNKSCNISSFGPHPLPYASLSLHLFHLSGRTGSVSAPCARGWAESWRPCCTSCGASARWLPWCFAAFAPCWAPPSPSCCPRRPTSTCRTRWRTWRGRTSGAAPPTRSLFTPLLGSASKHFLLLRLAQSRRSMFLRVLQRGGRRREAPPGGDGGLAAARGRGQDRPLTMTAAAATAT